jgi:hypothetical protein
MRQRIRSSRIVMEREMPWVLEMVGASKESFPALAQGEGWNEENRHDHAVNFKRKRDM